jgi:glycosyltransferase involved in cell wall biosynthesis
MRFFLIESRRMASKVCYLSTGIMDTAFDSQVLPTLEATHSQFNLLHLSVDPFRGKITEGYRHKRYELDSKGIRTVYVKQMPPFAKSFLMIDVMRMYRAFRVWGGREERIVIHGRGHLNAYRGLMLKEKYPGQIRVIADLRGAVTDEVGYVPSSFVEKRLSHYLKRLYERIEDGVVRQADAVLCVSNAFRQYLQSIYEVRPIAVIPTYVDTIRFKFSEALRDAFRKKLGISERTVLVYSGGVARWQKIDKVIQLFVCLREQIENLFMLFISSDPSAIREMIGSQIQQGDSLAIQVPHNEVGGYLCAADVGILLRERDLTNRVAAPIKFSEYMCCGLPCILSEGVGDTSEVIREANAGIVLDGQDSPRLPEIKRLLMLDRYAFSNSMILKYSSRIYLPRVMELYRTLAGDSEGTEEDLC